VYYMDYYVYIDESGQFKKKKEEYNRSIVAGFITNKTIEELDIELSRTIEKVNQAQNTVFTKNDIHIAPLLHPENAFKENEKNRFSQIDEYSRKEFAKACKKTLEDISIKLITSKNTSFDFGEVDEQARYGNTLCAFIHTVIDFIKTKHDVNSLKIYIAKRHPKCLPNAKEFSKKASKNELFKFMNDYHIKMTKYIQSWLKNALPEINLGIGFSSKYKTGYDFADIACYYLRESPDSFTKEKTLYTEPNKHFGDIYTETEINVIKELIAKKEFETAYKWSETKDEKEQILKLLIEQQKQIKIKSIPGLINIAYALIDKRTTSKGALPEAIQLFNYLIKACNNNPNSDEKLTDLMLSAVNGILICANHSGNKEQQQKALNIYKKNIITVSDIPYFTRQEKVLAVRNRVYNQQFNDYNFQSIIDDFESIVKKRIADLPGNEKDSLTGEMLGTIGQAYAFQSKNNKAFSMIAANYFTQSFYHFPVGHKYHGMSVNYLATLKWYQNDLSAAKIAMANHPGFDENKTASQLITQIIESKEYHFGTVFNISVLLRLAVEQGNVSNKAIESIEKFLKKCDINQHPYELIYKWIGIAYMKNSELDKALQAFDKSIELSTGLGFTVETLSVPVIGLKCVALEQQSKQTGLSINKLKVSIDNLSNASTHFAIYIDSIGGIEQMLKDIKNKDVNAIAKWLPFAYA
jgi:tetratricopeptide (TPR) repeat protein